MRTAREAWAEASARVAKDGRDLIVLRTGISPGPFDYIVVENLDYSDGSDLILGTTEREGPCKHDQPVFVREIMGVE